MRFITLERLVSLYTLQDLNQWLGREIACRYGQQNRGEVISLLRQAIQFKKGLTLPMQ